MLRYYAFFYLLWKYHYLAEYGIDVYSYFTRTKNLIGDYPAKVDWANWSAKADLDWVIVEEDISTSEDDFILLEINE